MGIEISLRSQELINEYKKAIVLDQQESFPIGPSMDLDFILSWLDDKPVKSSLPIKSQKSIEFILISLRAELLRDLYLSLNIDEVKTKEVNEKSNSNRSLKFMLLTFSGILVAACQGFDSIVTMMSIFSLPSVVIFFSGLIFSCFSIMVFCGFDLVKLSNSFGIKLSDAHKLLDAYCHQLKHIKLLRKKIADYDLSELSISRLKELERIVMMLEQRFKQLAQASKQLDKVLHNSGVELTKSVLFGISAALFFGGAFCSGQTVALYILGLFMAAVSPASAPVIIFSLLVGFAALSLFWYIEFPGLKILLDNWFGLNEEKVSLLCDEQSLVKEGRKLTSLKEKIIGASKLKDRLFLLEENSDPEKQKQIPISLSSSPKIGANPHSFLAPSSIPPSIDLGLEESLGLQLN